MKQKNLFEFSDEELLYDFSVYPTRKETKQEAKAEKQKLKKNKRKGNKK